MNNIHLVLNGQQSGPYSLEQVRELLREGKATPETMAWHEGLSGWTALGTVMTSSAGTPPPAPFFRRPQLPRQPRFPRRRGSADVR